MTISEWWQKKTPKFVTTPLAPRNTAAIEAIENSFDANKIITAMHAAGAPMVKSAPNRDNRPAWIRKPQNTDERRVSAMTLAPVVMATEAWLIMTPEERVAACFALTDEFYKQSFSKESRL